MKAGDLVRCKFVSPEDGNIYMVEEMIDYGKDGKGQTCTLLGWPRSSFTGLRRKFHGHLLEVISECR